MKAIELGKWMVLAVSLTLTAACAGSPTRADAQYPDLADFPVARDAERDLAAQNDEAIALAAEAEALRRAAAE